MAVNIQVEWKWLKYYIDQETSKSARCIITDNATYDLAMEAQTDNGQFDSDFCKRKVTEGCGKLKDTLYKFFDGFKVFNGSTEIGTAGDAALLDADKWQISFANFGERRDVNEQLLNSEVSQYLALYVLQEWSKVAQPKMEENYVARIAAEEIRIKSIIYRKKEPTRPE